MARYEVNHRWIMDPRWTPGSRLTLRATIAPCQDATNGSAHHALNDWLGGLRPAWLTLDGQPSLVAFDGGAFVELASSDDAAALPDVFISAAGDDAPEMIAKLAGDLLNHIDESLPYAEVRWEELPPRPFGRS